MTDFWQELKWLSNDLQQLVLQNFTFMKVFFVVDKLNTSQVWS